MNASDEDRLTEDPEDEDFEEEVLDDDEVSPELEADLEDDGEADDDDEDTEYEDIEAVVELSAKEQSARSLEIRRAIEERREKRKLEDDIDYLDLDLDD